jgi:hypothetical protein
MLNNNNDKKNYSAVYIKRKNREGKDSEYLSFTMEIGGYMYTCRVYASEKSSYIPKTGKHQGKKCYPVMVSRWEKNNNNNNW